MCMDWRDGVQMAREIVDLLTSLPQPDAERLQRNLETHEGQQELRELLMGFCRLTPGVRTALVARLRATPALRVCPAQEPEPDSSASA